MVVVKVKFIEAALEASDSRLPFGNKMSEIVKLGGVLRRLVYIQSQIVGY